MRYALSLLVAVAVLSSCGPSTEFDAYDRPWTKPCRAETLGGSTDTPTSTPEPSDKRQKWRTAYRFENGMSGAFLSLVAFSPTDVWSVVSTNYPGMPERQLLRWNGQSWCRVFVPGPSWGASERKEKVEDVAGTSGTDVWLLTSHRVLHWDGERWTSHDFRDDPTRSAVLRNVWDFDVVGHDDVWIVGFADDSEKSQAMHWDGRVWSVTAPPLTLGYTNTGSDGELWGANLPLQRLDNAGVDNRLSFARWDGRQWGTVDTPPITPPPGGEIDRTDGTIRAADILDMATGPSGEVWAAGAVFWTEPGEQFHPDEASHVLPLLLHWDGHRWTYTIHSGKYPDGYSHVAPDGAGGVWTVHGRAAYVHHDRSGRVVHEVDAPAGRARRAIFEVHRLINVPGRTSMLAAGVFEKPTLHAELHAYG